MCCSADGSRNFVCPVPPDCARLGGVGVGSGYVELMGKYYDACQSYYLAVRCGCRDSCVRDGVDVGGSEGSPGSIFVGEVGGTVESVVPRFGVENGINRFSGNSLRQCGTGGKGKVYTLMYARKQLDRVDNLVCRLERTGKIANEQTLSSRDFWKGVVAELTLKSDSVSDSKKKLLELELVETRLKKEKEQLAISQVFRLRQEKLDNDAAVIVNRLDDGKSEAVSEYWKVKAEREKCQLEISQGFKKRQERIDREAEGTADRRRLAAVARSDIMVMRAETMKINRDKRNERLAEVERKENWREGATGIPSVQGSVKTASSSGSVSVDSSVSQRCSGSSDSSSSSRVSSVDYGIADISTVAREKNLDRSKYTLAQQAYIEMKRNDLIVYNCEPGTWLGDAQVVKRVNRPVSVVKHVAPVAKVTASDVLKGLLK